jgi:DNA-binding PadR family transcriptional regulator
MNLQDIKDYFQSPLPKLAPKELVTAYVAYAIAQTDNYGTDLIQDFEGIQAPGWRLADVNLYAALKFLESHNLIEGYWQPIDGKHRHRRMYRPAPGREGELRELGELFSDWKIKNIGGWG